MLVSNVCVQGAGVADTIRSGITNIDYFTARPDILAYGACQSAALLHSSAVTLVDHGSFTFPLLGTLFDRAALRER